MAILSGALLLAAFAARPAVAQITLGSPADPPHLALSAGAFDITPSRHRNAGTAAQFGLEYRFGDVVWAISPFLGVSASTKGAVYPYGGFGVDVNFTPNIVLTPNVAAGYFERGAGTNLGSHMEWRSGVELAYRFADLSRLGIAVEHTSNAGLTRINPGEQSVLLVYGLPLH